VTKVQVLVGLGMGPGDPELVTVKAVRVLRAADVVLVPVMAADEPGRAEATVRAHLTDPDDPRVRRVVFALDDRGGVTPRRAAAWEGAADAVVAAFRDGAETVAFATIGDPAVYSTFAYLAQTVRERVPHASVETVPGITAMQDLAARTGTVLAEGRERLALVPGAEVPEGFDTVVLYKAGRHLPAVRKAHANVVYGEDLGTPSQTLEPPDGPAPYMSTVIVK
jgi:precorrin-2/cobalt-factor-2 C20-methyltransferase